jgi:hypothetical protein
MPFSKSIVDNSGVASTYWVITHVQADMSAQTVMVTISGWLDQAAYASAKKPSARRPFYFSVPFASIPSASTGSISMDELYTAVVGILANPPRGNASPLAGATIVA